MKLLSQNLISFKRLSDLDKIRVLNCLKQKKVRVCKHSRPNPSKLIRSNGLLYKIYKVKRVHSIGN